MSLSRLLGIGIVLVQLFDIVIHVASNQAEPMRITSNIVIIVWIVVILLGWLTERLRTTSIATLGIYLLLNLIFLAQNGFTNPEQGDAPRTMLFFLVTITLVLSGLFAARLLDSK